MNLSNKRTRRDAYGRIKSPAWKIGCCKKCPVSEISCLILNDIGAVRLRTAAADCGHVGCGIVIVAYAHNLAVGECVEPHDLTLERATGRLRHASPPEDRGHIIAADEVGDQLTRS